MEKKTKKIGGLYCTFFNLLWITLIVIVLFLIELIKIFNIYDLIFFVIPIFSVFVIWHIIQTWARKNKEKIPGNTFEYAFLVFIFIATILFTLIIYFSDKGKLIVSLSMNILFISSIISIAYSGWLYFIEGISRIQSMKSLKKVYKQRKK